MNIFSKGNILSILAWMFCSVYRAGFAYLDRSTVQFLREDKPDMGNRLPDGLDHLPDISNIDRNYVLVGDEVATEKIFICKNYSRMKIIDHLSAVILENPGTALIIDIGDLADPNKYAAGLNLSAGGTFLLSAAPGVNNQDPIITSDEDLAAQGPDIFATITTATSLTAGQKIRFKLSAAVNS